MKTLLATILSFLILALASCPLLVLGTSSVPEPLLDVNGNKVESTLQYHIVSAIWGAGGGGVSLHGGRNGYCPLDVIQLPSAIQWGKKLILSPYDNSTIVRESTDLNLRFVGLLSGSKQCNELPLWKVDNYDASSGRWFITTGGLDGAYKIVHCPSVCESCVKLCSSVGRFSFEDGVRRLVLVRDDEPAFPVVLIPARERSTSV
ncbi:Kunitz trypsin inhibitor 5 [Citrus sinensis]|uniref:Kunitz trypsin inhibitor 5 n=1 Tax=Citrus sinensis TaxID=2711 RepID=A0ACB8M5Z3_CITSI|nr:Kunitz trypsin inhibitor 5 [Citrus sinensis]